MRGFPLWLCCLAVSAVGFLAIDRFLNLGTAAESAYRSANLRAMIVLTVPVTGLYIGLLKLAMRLIRVRQFNATGPPVPAIHGSADPASPGAFRDARRAGRDGRRVDVQASLRRLVADDEVPVLQAARAEQVEAQLLHAALEQRSAFSEDDGMDHELVFVDQPARGQSRDDGTASQDHQIGASLFLQLLTSVAGSPFSSVVLLHVTVSSVLENTYLGISFIPLATTGSCL
jgi:hypothetical protein